MPYELLAYGNDIRNVTIEEGDCKGEVIGLTIVTAQDVDARKDISSQCLVEGEEGVERVTYLCTEHKGLWAVPGELCDDENEEKPRRRYTLLKNDEFNPNEHKDYCAFQNGQSKVQNEQSKVVFQDPGLERAVENLQRATRRLLEEMKVLKSDVAELKVQVDERCGS